MSCVNSLIVTPCGLKRGSPPKDGTFCRVEIRTNKDYKIEGRPGYYAVAQQDWGCTVHAWYPPVENRDGGAGGWL
jgi:hypothetical protein